MLLPSVATDSAEARNAAPRLGLQTLIAAAPRADAAAAGANVATRTMAASRRAVCGGGGCDDAGGGGEDEGCWVSYGWRRRLRRLPPPIPAHRPLARARAADGRLVISREEPAHRVCGRKVDDRLVLELVDRDATPAPPPQRRRWSHPLPLTAGHEATAPPPVADDDDKEAAAAAAAAEDGATASRDGTQPTQSAQAQAPTTEPPVGPGSPAPAVACFDGAIRAASLCATPSSLPRMVH